MFAQAGRHTRFLEPLQQTLVELAVRLGVSLEDVVFDEVVAEQVDLAALSYRCLAQQRLAAQRELQPVGDARQDSLLLFGDRRLDLLHLLACSLHRRITRGKRHKLSRVLSAQRGQLFLEALIGGAPKVAGQVRPAAHHVFDKHRNRLSVHAVRLGPGQLVLELGQLFRGDVLARLDEQNRMRRRVFAQLRFAVLQLRFELRELLFEPYRSLLSGVPLGLQVVLDERLGKSVGDFRREIAVRRFIGDLDQTRTFARTHSEPLQETFEHARMRLASFRRRLFRVDVANELSAFGEPQSSDHAARQSAALEDFVLRLKIVGLFGKLRKARLAQPRDIGLLAVDLHRGRGAVGRRPNCVVGSRRDQRRDHRRQHRQTFAVKNAPVVAQLEAAVVAGNIKRHRRRGQSRTGLRACRTEGSKRFGESRQLLVHARASASAGPRSRDLWPSAMPRRRLGSARACRRFRESEAHRAARAACRRRAL